MQNSLSNLADHHHQLSNHLTVIQLTLENIGVAGFMDTASYNALVCQTAMAIEDLRRSRESVCRLRDERGGAG
jgi:hypothetical protein